MTELPTDVLISGVGLMTELLWEWVRDWVSYRVKERTTEVGDRTSETAVQCVRL
jgi:hypothetical protein